MTSVFKSNATTTMNEDNDDNDDNETPQRATPSSSIANPELPGKDFPQQDVHGATLPLDVSEVAYTSTRGHREL